jgi:hypothetical protein
VDLLLGQHLDLLDLGFEDFLAFVQLLFIVLEQAILLELKLQFLLEGVLAFFQPALLIALLVFGLLDLAIEFLAFVEDFVLGLELGFFAKVFRPLSRLRKDFGGAILGAVEIEAIMTADELESPEGATSQAEKAGKAAEQNGIHEGHSVARRLARQRRAAIDTKRPKTPTPLNPAARRAVRARAALRFACAGPWPGSGPAGAALGPAPALGAPEDRAVCPTGAAAPGWPEALPAPGPRKATRGGS